MTRSKAMNRTIGLAVASIRRDRGWTQNRLARAMSAIGEPWHQATVSRVEAAERPVSIAEGILLAEVLGCEFAELFRTDQQVPSDREIKVVLFGVTDHRYITILEKIREAVGSTDADVTG